MLDPPPSPPLSRFRIAPHYIVALGIRFLVLPDVVTVRAISAAIASISAHDLPAISVRAETVVRGLAQTCRFRAKFFGRRANKHNKANVTIPGAAGEKSRIVRASFRYLLAAWLAF